MSRTGNYIGNLKPIDVMDKWVIKIYGRCEWLSNVEILPPGTKVLNGISYCINIPKEEAVFTTNINKAIRVEGTRIDDILKCLSVLMPHINFMAVTFPQ